MKKFYLLTLIVALFAACTNDTTEDLSLSAPGTLRVSFDNQSRVELDHSCHTVWTKGDKVSVFHNSDSNDCYQYQGETGEREGILLRTAQGTATTTADKVVVVYPYNENYTISHAASSVDVTIPAVQYYKSGSYGVGANLMVATGTGDNFSLKSLCGWVKLQFKGSEKLTKITLRGNDDEQIAGSATANYDNYTLALIAANLGSSADGEVGGTLVTEEEYVTEITLDLGEGVQLTETPTDFYFTLAPQTFTKGITVTATADNGTYMTQTTDKEITISRNAIQPMAVVDLGHQAQLALEREALIAIYNALDGDNWENNENWCSDKPVSEWYGVSLNEDGNVCYLTIYGVKSGNIPNEICYLENLEDLYLASHYLSEKSFLVDMLRKLKQLKKLTSLRIEGHSWYGTSGFTGIIPDELWDLTNLEVLFLEHNSFTGGLSSKIGNLKNLKHLSLLDCQLKGELPSELGNLTQLKGIDLKFNQFTGRIPEEFFKTEAWKNNWAEVIAENNGFANLFFGENNNFTLDNLVIPAKKWDNLYDINGKVVDFQDIYESNKYTILYQYAPNDGYWEKMREIYKYYNSQIEIIGWGTYWEPCSYSGIEDFVKQNNIEWISIGGDYMYPTSSGIFDGVYRSYITVVDNNGYVVFSDHLTSRVKLIHFLNQNLGGNMAEDTYFSSDYSQDGIVSTLQTATKGNGIDIILMGDGYSDRQIADGTYKGVMQSAYEKFFSVEPYKSHKELFNVYCINVISETEGYEYSFLGATALGGYFGGGTLVVGDDSAAMNYALNAIDESRMEDANIVVMMNSENYAGTCYMYYPSQSGDYGRGVSVSYFPVGTDSSQLEQLLHHEACGHGFAKLADEYAYESMGAVAADYVSQIQSQQSDWGWWKNVDFTSDPAAVLWAKFIADSRYSNEGLGAFEGGLTYWTGVWRPTENSIMRYNTGGFNVPSREAIYYRIHKLAYGDSWQYDYEKFVEWDAINRTQTATPAAFDPMILRHREPTTPPVVVGKTWREALQK